MRVGRRSVVCVALIAMVWCTATVSAQATPWAQATPPSARATPPSAQTTPPSAQILTAADVSGVAVGQWAGTCGYLGAAESPMIGCTISRTDDGDGLRALGLQLDPIPAGMSVAAARAAWRLQVDPHVTPGVQTLRALPNLGDEAYLVTG